MKGAAIHGATLARADTSALHLVEAEDGGQHPFSIGDVRTGKDADAIGLVQQKERRLGIRRGLYAAASVSSYASCSSLVILERFLSCDDSLLHVDKSAQRNTTRVVVQRELADDGNQRANQSGACLSMQSEPNNLSVTRLGIRPRCLSAHMG